MDGYKGHLTLSDDNFSSRHLIKKLEFSFKPYSTQSEKEINKLWTYHKFGERTVTHRKDMVLAIVEHMCLEAWKNSLQTIAHLAGLKHIIMDIKSAYCPHGCCRLIDNLCQLLRRLRFVKQNVCVAVLGQVLEGENARVAGAIDRGVITVFYQFDKYAHMDIMEEESTSEEAEDEAESTQEEVEVDGGLRGFDDEEAGS